MLRIFSGCLTILLILTANAFAFSGKKKIFLTTEADDKTHIADIEFTKEGDRSSYKINWFDEKFGDHFLSMRPFKCLEGETKYWCRVPYPYPIKRYVSSDDLTDLEYDLLFIWKGAGEYGINMWNGVYYQMEVDGQKIVGTINDMDMDKLSAPPPEGNFRPIWEVDLEPGEPSSHWLPKVIIE